EYALKSFKAAGVIDFVVDLRWNSGGVPLGLAGFLSDKPIFTGQLEYFSEETGRFEPDGPVDRFRPLSPEDTFHGVGVLVGPGCASACEYEAYAFAQLPNAIVVGQYPSSGIEAEVSRGQFALPEDIFIQIPTGRIVNADGSLFLEGVGVVPDVHVPVT